MVPIGQESGKKVKLTFEGVNQTTLDMMIMGQPISINFNFLSEGRINQIK